ncbi:uncharacterized protein LOC133645119 isoform X4 [Entelurus aequoreus]|uniref:uncharacterized protein LOC133645119 isoform X4 n=1 Tax=Entelurus aequoreus TaxID=161455 RepID=UPI002B1E621C|nr:uncharacterized protein LOC133645119 isoform X4 [Entelurus aequoreus]
MHGVRTQTGSQHIAKHRTEHHQLIEEEEELWITEEREGLPGQEGTDLTKFPLTVVSVETEDHKDKPEFSQLHQSPKYHHLIGRGGTVDH